MIPLNTDKSQGQPPLQEREVRTRKMIRVELEREYGPAFPAMVTNLSSNGLGGHTEGFLRPFELITIVKKGYGRISGEVRWTEGENFGILFAEPVDIDLFNFSDRNKRATLLPQTSEDDVWQEFNGTDSTGRPGGNSQYSES